MIQIQWLGDEYMAIKPKENTLAIISIIEAGWNMNTKDVEMDRLMRNMAEPNSENRLVLID